MQKQALKQSSSTDNFRFKINFAPVLVKHAQELRKDAGFLYTGPDGAPPALDSPESVYNENIGWLGRAVLLGLGVGGSASLLKNIRRSSVADLAVPRSSTNLPLGLSFTRRKKKRRRKPEEEDLTRYEKAAQKTPDVGILGGDMAPVVMWPAMAALSSAGFLGGMSLVDYIAEQRRKRVREDQLQDAKDTYSEALREQFATGNRAPEEDEKVAFIAEDSGGELDRIYDGLVKYSDDGFNAFQGHQFPFAGKAKWLWDQARDHANLGTAGKGAGFLSLVAALTALGTGHMVYKSVRSAPGRRNIISEAMRRRKSELARRQPQAIHLTPGEVEEVEEDGPITGSAI
jgi:hypothetical protein